MCESVSSVDIHTGEVKQHLHHLIVTAKCGCSKCLLQCFLQPQLLQEHVLMPVLGKSTFQAASSGPCAQTHDWDWRLQEEAVATLLRLVRRYSWCIQVLMRCHLFQVRQNMIADLCEKNILLDRCSYRYWISKCDGQV